MRIPLVDLGRQHEAVAGAIADGWARVLGRRSFVLGEEGAAFEAEFAAFCRAAHCVGVGNGTDALELALRAAGVGPGDEVVVPAFTFVATAMAVVRAGATPVPVDVAADTGLVDPAAAGAALSDRTRAIVPVHLFGQMADMRALGALVDGTGVALVEDAAQAHGASQHGRPVGFGSTAAAISFYPSKNLGAYGDAGAVLTGDAAVADRVRRLRNYGSASKYEHVEEGFNSRLDELQAVVLRAKLGMLGRWNEQREAAARRYGEALRDVDGVELPVTAAGNRHVWHLYVVRVDDRDRVLERLRRDGVGAAVHYPVPIHRQPAFAGAARRLARAERLAARVLSLPLFPGIRDDEVDYVAEALRRAVRNPSYSRR
ncbi:MAG TPA: DegT/DnrJ/EryC1/StrS family aminotransferase [Solirubrobacteraceae bacterium]|nr:DegT/DnrJ/EryC1/StrS family aminotransferase [Solirubrobacteraceae bacterium]